MATHVSVIKQNKVDSDNMINQSFKADYSKDYYDGQALKITSGVVAPVSSGSDVVFGISTCKRGADSTETNFQVNLRQPRTGDTFLLETDFDLADANIGTYYGIIPEVDDDSDPTGGYLISTTGTSLQWRLISILGKRLGEFEFKRYTSTDAAVEQNEDDIADLEPIQGTTAPTAKPTKIGDHYIDTTNGKVYLAKGTSSTSDRVALN